MYTPPFTATAMDFLGSFKVKVMNNSRILLKVWSVVFGCLNTGAVHLELNKTYGTDALLLSITAFTSIRGYAATFYTDQALNSVKLHSIWTLRRIPLTGAGTRCRKLSRLKNRRINSVCLDVSGRMVRLSSESMVSMTLELTMMHGSTSLDYAEFRTLLVNCADRMNSRPLGVMLGEDDLQPLTPNHLLIGRTQSGSVSKEVLDEGLERAK